MVENNILHMSSVVKNLEDFKRNLQTLEKRLQNSGKRALYFVRYGEVDDLICSWE